MKLLYLDCFAGISGDMLLGALPSFGGIAALLAMLNSCASGVTVANINNGFGAGYAASVINQLAKT